MHCAFYEEYSVNNREKLSELLAIGLHSMNSLVFRSGTYID